MADLVNEGRELQNKMRVKLKEDATQQSLEEMVDEFAELSDQIDELNAKLKKMKTHYEELDAILVPIMEHLKELGQNSIQTKKYLLTIKHMGYDRTNKSYKDGFELALTKVNATIRNILEEALKSTETTTKVAASLGVQKLAQSESLHETDGMLKNFVNKLKSFVQRIVMKIRAAKVEMKTLDAIAKKIIATSK